MVNRQRKGLLEYGSALHSPSGTLRHPCAAAADVVAAAVALDAAAVAAAVALDATKIERLYR